MTLAQLRKLSVMYSITLLVCCVLNAAALMSSGANWLNVAGLFLCAMGLGVRLVMPKVKP